MNLFQVFINTSTFVYNCNLIYAYIFYLYSNKDHAFSKTRFHAQNTKKINCPATIIQRDIVVLTDYKVRIIWGLVLHHMLLCDSLLLMWITPRKNYWKDILTRFKPQVLCCASLLLTSSNTGIYVRWSKSCKIYRSGLT